jgi:hypothetical protein
MCLEYSETMQQQFPTPRDCLPIWSSLGPGVLQHHLHLCSFGFQWAWHLYT